MEGNGLTVADALALRNSNGNGNNGNDMFGGNGAWQIPATL